MKQEQLNEILESHTSWLNGADGKRADLRGADLRDTYLRGADLRYADLSGVILSDDIPKIKDIKSKIPLDSLNMSTWHNECGTVHCLAGWACVLAGDKHLEEKYSTKTLGALIFHKSCGEIPDFYSSTEDAIKWLKK